MRNIVQRLGAVVASLALLAGLLFPAIVSAQTNPFLGACTGRGTASPACAGGATGASDDPVAGPHGAIISVTSILALVAAIVAIVTLLLGGFKYITSGGDASGISSAKEMITASLVGLVLAALARPVVVFIVSKL
jgi:hypothetical protein